MSRSRARNTVSLRAVPCHTGPIPSNHDIGEESATRPVRFIHAADVHLGAAFKRVTASDTRVADALLEAVSGALNRVVEACLANDVDFLVLAGDVFDDADPSVRSRLAFAAAARRLAAANIPIYLVRGNHDPADSPGAADPAPPGVHVFSSGEVERIEHRAATGAVLCTLYGRSFPTRSVRDDYASGFRRTSTDRLAIGVLHTNVGGRVDFEDYAPTTAAELAGAGMDYWALGHIHAPGPADDGVAAFYAGSPQGLQPNETGEHGCYLVTLHEDASPQVEQIPAASVMWEQTAVDVSNAVSFDEVRGLIAEECARLRRRCGLSVIARITLTGRSEADVRLARPGALEDLVAFSREEQLAEEPWVWVDRIHDMTRTSFDLDALRAEAGFAGDLVARADALLADPEAADTAVRELVDAAQASVPVRPGITLETADVIDRARDRCLDLLIGGES